MYYILQDIYVRTISYTWYKSSFLNLCTFCSYGDLHMPSCSIFLQPFCLHICFKYRFMYMMCHIYLYSYLFIHEQARRQMRFHLQKSTVMKLHKTYDTLEKFKWENMLEECTENLPLLTSVLKASFTSSHKQSYVEMYELIPVCI